MRVVPVKVLLALTLTVLLAHWALLHEAAFGLHVASVLSVSSFSTRTIESRPPQTSAAAPTTTPPIKRSKPVAPPPAPPPVSEPDPADTLASTTAVPPVTPVEQLPEPLPAEPGAPISDAAPLAEPERQPELPSLPTEPLITQIFPESLRLLYEGQSNRMLLQRDATLSWNPHGDSYNARLDFGKFVLVQTSAGAITSRGLAPSRFTDKRSFKSEVAAHFLPEQGKISFSANTPEVALQAGAQDQLSILLQLAATLAAAPELYHVGSQFPVQVVGSHFAETWLIEIVGIEALDLRGGPRSTLKLLRNPHRPYDQKLELWMAPDMHFLPVRFRITEANGDYVDQKWIATETPS